MIVIEKDSRIVKSWESDIMQQYKIYNKILVIAGRLRVYHIKYIQKFSRRLHSLVLGICQTCRLSLVMLSHILNGS